MLRVRCLVAILILCSLCNVFAQDSLDKLRQELIADVDQKLEQLREELIAQIDKKLALKSGSGFLGVNLQNLSPGLRKLLNIPANQGVLVKNVAQNGPAALAGIRNMDVILSFDGKKVNDVKQLQQLVASSQPGKKVAIEVLQRRTRKVLEVKIGERAGSLPPSQPKLEDELQQLLKKFPPGQMEDLQKQFEQQLKVLEQNPEIKEQLKNLQSVFKDLEKGNLKDIMEKIMPKPNGNQVPDVQEEAKDDTKEKIDSLLDDLLGSKKPQEEKTRKTTPKAKPHDELDSLLDDLLEEKAKVSNNAASKAYLGLTFIPIPSSLRERENFIESHGLLVAKVNADSPAEKAGVKKWDIVLDIGGKKISSTSNAKKVIGSFKPKEKATITVFSRGQTKKLSVVFSAN